MNEKREHPRFLCDEYFGDATLASGKGSLSARSINFNHLGLALFTPNFLPEGEQRQISFRYHSEDRDLLIQQIPCLVIYANETEVGNLYGIHFQSATLNEEICEKLRCIEGILAQRNQLHGRYGIEGNS